MINNQPSDNKQTSNHRKGFDLEERTEKFARDVRIFVRGLPRSTANQEDTKQLVRASGSVAANYIEANESLSKKDFVMRMKICRKEAKEARLWLRLIDVGTNSALETERQRLIKEVTELFLICNSIVTRNS